MEVRLDPAISVYMIVMNDLNVKDVCLKLLTPRPSNQTAIADAPVEPVVLTPSGCDAERAERAIRELLLALGENPDREGLRDTPGRVARAFAEMCSGLHQDPAAPLERRFSSPSQELVLVTDIDFTSLCEHHLLPFTGRAHVAYLPTGGQLVGLSKIARSIEILARRPQIQESLTCQIADVLEQELRPAGALVVVEAAHACLRSRGARKSRSAMTTTAHRGRLRDDAGLREEAHRLIATRRVNSLESGADRGPFTWTEAS
jgi:GTP cyclohydrolase IA